VESEPDVGSEFIFTATFGIGETVEKTPLTLAEDLQHLKVLVVDDNRSSRQILGEMLQSFNFSVYLAASGKEAVTMFKEAEEESPYQLVLMDWKMPGMDGIETTRRMLEGIGTKKVPKMIMATAFDPNDVLHEIGSVGFDGLLMKPVTHSGLLNAILQAFGKADALRMVKGSVKDREAEAARDIRGARILLVEDNEINQQVAKEILEGAGLSVTIAENGRVGVDLVNRESFEAVLMDVQMPVMDGYQATREIRNLKFEEVDSDGQASSIQHPASSIPIIAMTASAMIQDREKAEAAGMNDHVSKPIDIDELFTALTTWIKPGEHSFEENPSENQEKETLPPKTTSDVEALPDLPGISTDSGLKRVGGNLVLYKKLLIKFHDEYPDAARQIREALDKEDIELAQRLAHTVKGVSGNLGFEDLQEVGQELESAIKKEELEKARNLLSPFSKALSAVTSSLKILSPSPEKGPKKKNMETEPLETLLPMLDKLQPLVQKRKAKPSKETMAEIAAKSWSDEVSGEIVDLKKWIDKYKFKDAKAVLDALILKLKQTS